MANKKTQPAVHPWRVCPYGEHWVRTHPMHVPPSKTQPEGSVTTRHDLMQITNETRKLLDNPKELKDHHIVATREDLNDPGINICAGVRWLFRKREIASAIRLKHQATWIEAAEEFKGDLKGLLNKNPKSQNDVLNFLKYLQELEKCEG